MSALGQNERSLSTGEATLANASPPYMIVVVVVVVVVVGVLGIRRQISVANMAH